MLNVISVSFIQFKVILVSVILLLEHLLLSVNCTVTLFFNECHSAHFYDILCHSDRCHFVASFSSNLWSVILLSQSALSGINILLTVIVNCGFIQASVILNLISAEYCSFECCSAKCPSIVTLLTVECHSVGCQSADCHSEVWFVVLFKPVSL
jgi:hypothetical protein